MASKMRAADVLVGDLIETHWNGCKYRVVEVTPSSSGEIVEIGTVVEVSGDPLLAVGRIMNFGRRAGTLVLVHRTQWE
jgi:hypothetical protein